MPAEPSPALLPARRRWPDRLRQGIAELLGRFQETETYRGLVRLGLDYLVTATKEESCGREDAVDEFRELLVDQGLSQPRASEVTVILLDNQVAVRFTATTKPISLRRAICDARRAHKAAKQQGSALRPRTPADLAASRRLERIRRDADKLLAEADEQDVTWPLNFGVYRLDFSADSGSAQP
jgi:hypothetical protein